VRLILSLIIAGLTVADRIEQEDAPGDEEGKLFGESDGYDYAQHLRPIGTSGGIYIAADQFPEDVKQFSSKQKKKKRLPMDFPQEALPNVSIFMCWEWLLTEERNRT
jgi:hypothetical protein